MTRMNKQFIIVPALVAVALAQSPQVDWPLQVKRKPFLDPLGFQYTRTNGLSASGDLSASGAGKVVSVTPCPQGIANSAYISGGSGTPEVASRTGGTCTAGAASGTLILTTANTHTGAWTLTSAAGGIPEALGFGGANTTVDCASQQITLYGPITISNDNVTLRGSGCKISGTPANGSTHIAVASGVDNFTMDGVWLDNTNTNPSNVYDLFRFLGNNVNTNIQNSKFTGSGGVHGVNGVQVNVTGVVGAHIDKSYFSGLSFGVLTNLSADDVADVSITRCTMVAIWGDGIQLNTYELGSYVAARSFRITDNYIETNLASVDAGSGFCIGIAGPSKGVVANNTLHNCRYQALHWESGTLQLQGPLDWVIDGNQADVTGTGFPTLNHTFYFLNCRYCVITNNVSTSATNNGFMLDYNGIAANYERTEGVVLSGNIARLSGSSGFYMSGAPGSTAGVAPAVQSKWNINGNISISSTGCGFHFVGFDGAPSSINLTGNIAQHNTSAGLCVDGAPPDALTIKSNDLWNNTGGDILYGTAGRAPVTIQDMKFFYTDTAAGGGNSTYTNTFKFGSGVKGFVAIRAYDLGAPSTNWAVAIFDLTGTAPTITSLVTNGSGSTVNTIAIQSSGGYIQVRAANAGGSPITIAFDVQFTGLAFRN